MKDLFSLQGKVAIVTGATGLLGREHCLALMGQGAKVVVADLDQARCDTVAAEIGGGAIGVAMDVTSRPSLEAATAKILSQLDRVDILVNNAAINDMFENPALAGDLSKFENYPEAMWRKMVDVNVTGVFLASQVVGAKMAAAGRGSIINIGSTYGMVGPDQSIYKSPEGEQILYKSPAYSTTKGAVLAFTRFLAAYWGKSGVRVNTLSPGGVENNQSEFFIEAYSKRTPLGRMAAPGDYRGALVFLASDASSYMTGANLVVDGGWTAW